MDSYSLIYHQVSTAEKLSYASMALVFGAQAMFIIRIISDDGLDYNAWIVSSFACTGISFCLALGSTTMTYRARKTLGEHGGTLGLNLGKDGVGAVYHFPK